MHAFWSLNEEISRYCSDNLYAVSIKEDTAYPCLHFTRNHEDLKPYTPYLGDSIRRIEDYLKILEDIERALTTKVDFQKARRAKKVEMDDANHTMEEYIELEAEKACRRGQMFLWETATYEKARYHENIRYFKDFETNFPAIVFDDALATDHKISSEPTVSLLDDNEIDFRISFDESDNEDYTFIYDKNSFSCKLIPVNNLKTDSENDNDEVNISLNDVVVQIVVLVSMLISNPMNMAPLHARDQRHPWLRYEGHEYTDAIIHDYEDRLGRIFGRHVNRIQVLDFEGLTEEMRQALTDRLRMVYTDAEGQVLFTSDAWRRVFEIRGPLVLELMLEFFSTCRISDTVLDLDTADTLCFQLGRLRRQISWRQFIIAMGLHTVEEMETDGFRAYWTGSLREITSKADLREYWSRIAFDGDFLGPVPSYT
ncbi:hypothetical protein Tco_0480500, partial [Tanacetum coccineum]